MTSLTLDRHLSIEERAGLAKIPGDLSIYSKAVHGLELEPYQLAWEHALNTEDRICIVCPPDTFKSTTVQHWVEREIGHDHDTRILWLMNAGEQAQKRVMAIANTITQNRVYRQAFNVVPNKDSGQWTNTVLYVKRTDEESNPADPTLMGCGLNGPYQGLHFKIIIIDDPTDQEDVRSPTTMELQEQKIRGVVQDRLVDGGRQVVILTRWGENDLVHVFESMGFTIVEMPVMSDEYVSLGWGPTISRRRFPIEKVERIRQDKGDALFQLTFMCNEKALAGGLIRREHIRYWDKNSIPSAPMNIFMGVDPAASEKTYNDPRAIATVGIDTKFNRMYLLDMYASYEDVPDFELNIVKRAQGIKGLRAIGVETKAFQLSLVQYLKRHRRLPLVELPYRSRREAMRGILGIDNDKASRAAYLDSLFISGRLFIPRNLPTINGVSYEAELCSVPTGRHDDRMDATVFACALADAMFSKRPKIALRGFS